MKKIFLNSRGTSTVEFALTVFGYFLVVAMILELARLALASAYLDLAITQATTISKNQEADGKSRGDYSKLFAEAFKERQKLQRNSVMGYLAVQENKVDINVDYADTIDDLLNGVFRQPVVDSDGKILPPSGKDASIAVYSIKYDYEFIVSIPFLSGSLDNVRKSVLNRKIVTVQEYERNRFRSANN